MIWGYPYFWNYHIPYQPALFESMIFPNFPLSVGDTGFLSFFWSSHPGANDHNSPTWNTLKQKGPTSIPSLEGRLFTQMSASQKSSLFSTSLAQSQRIIPGSFHTKISHLQLGILKILILRHTHTHTQGHAVEVKFGIW